MPYVLAFCVITLYLYFRFGKKALAGALALLALLVLARGFVVMGIPLLLVAYWLIKDERLLPKIGGRSTSRSRSTDRPGVPTIHSRFVTLYLDAFSGKITGLVAKGPLVGSPLVGLSQDELKQLWGHYLKSDKESCALLEAFLDQAFPTWRQAEGMGQESDASSRASWATSVNRREAAQVLGLSSSASEDEIKQAHRQLMKKFHPDQGGAEILAAKINIAKDRLL